MRPNALPAIWVVLGSTLLAASPVLAHGKEAHAPNREPARTEKLRVGNEGGNAEAAAASYFGDAELVDQDGRPHRFYSDLVRGKTVLINFIFASCKEACSPVTANLVRVQKKLGSKVGKEISMLTLSVDPVNDTPEALRRYARRFGAGPGWYFLTGKPSEVEALVRKLGGSRGRPEEHSTALFIGNPSTGNWLKAPGIERADSIVYAVEHLDDDLP